MLEEYELSRAPSLTVLYEMRARQESDTEPAPVELLAFGDPVVASETTASSKAHLKEESYGPLPDARREVSAINALRGGRGELFLGEDATERRFKTAAAKADVIQLAVHGRADNKQPLRSRLLLAGDKRGGTEDGSLTAEEIMAMKLRANLVVLSACESGRGRVGAGEGMISLAWAFHVAGVPTTVVSQWNVESSSTAKLMIGFHSYPTGKDSGKKETKANALRRAGVDLLNDKSKKYQHPYYWAPLVMIGDGR